MRTLLGLIILAALLVGCGESAEPPSQAAAQPAATAEASPKGEHDLEGYSPGVVEYYGQPHEHADTEFGNAEAEYHQPPKPAEAKLGGTIELTGTEIGVRFKVTVTKVKPVENDLMAVYLKLTSTGVTVYDRPMESATITYPGEEPTPLDTDATAKCSNGLDGNVRMDDSRSYTGCLLFPRSGNAKPERFQLALEVVPTLAGGIWNLK